MKIHILVLSVGVFLCSCSWLTEPPRKIWGSSTQALEKQRVANALTAQINCSFIACFESVLALSKEAEYEVFIQDRHRRHVIVMGIKGNVNTTEVGIFLDEKPDHGTQVDITSLSSTAKEKVADVIFGGLKSQFGEI